MDELNRDTVEYQKLQDHFLAIIFMQPKLRDLAKNLKPIYFSEGPARTILEFLAKYPDFKGLPTDVPSKFTAQEKNFVSKLKPVGDYVKIMGLQFEELYRDLPGNDLRELANNLKHRLLMRYVKNRKQELVTAMGETDDETKLNKLMRQADKLNELIK